MSALVAHYAGSTGRLQAAVSYAEIILRVALDHPQMPAERLRENMQMVLDEMRQTLAEQKVRDEALGWKAVQPREAA